MSIEDDVSTIRRSSRKASEAEPLGQEHLDSGQCV